MSLQPVNQSSPLFDPLVGTDDIPVPEELALLILSFLTPEELGRSCLVSKRWNQLASTEALWENLIKTHFPMLKQIDQKAWEKYVDLEQHGLSFKDLPELNIRTLIPELSRFAALPIEGDAGFTLMTLPAGLSFNKLVEIAQDPKEGRNSMLFDDIWEVYQQQLGNVETEKSCMILITDSILEGSRNKSAKEQQDLFGEMPSVLGVTTLITMTFIITGERLYPLVPRVTYTRCSNQVSGQRMVVGGFGSVGLHVDNDYFYDNCYGVAGFRKFS